MDTSRGPIWTMFQTDTFHMNSDAPGWAPEWTPVRQPLPRTTKENDTSVFQLPPLLSDTFEFIGDAPTFTPSSPSIRSTPTEILPDLAADLDLSQTIDPIPPDAAMPTPVAATATTIAEADPPPTSLTFGAVRGALEKQLPQDMMFVITAGQSLSRGTSLRENLGTVWEGAVDADRAFMLDFDRPGTSARGWDYAPADPKQFNGLTAMQSHVTETPTPAMVAQILDAYDRTGRIAPDVLAFNTAGIGASVIELMASASDLVATIDMGLRTTSNEDIFILARTDGKYDYYVNADGQAEYLTTARHDPGLWDTMQAQIGFAAEAAAQAGYGVYDTVAMAFIHGQADARLSHDTFTYGWAVTRYFDMVEAELRQTLANPDLRLVVSLTQVTGDEDGNVPLDQLDLILSDDRVHFGGTQMEFQGRYPSNPGADHIHLSPEGYVHLGETVGAYLGQAILGRPEDPILISSVTRDGARTLLVTFSGIEGQLFSDPTTFTDTPGLSAPAMFGFALTPQDSADTGPAITAAEIIDADTVRLTLDQTLNGAWRLSLGLHGQDLSDSLSDTAFESYNGTTLRDSAATTGMIVPDGYRGDHVDVYEYAPTQYFDFWI